MKKQDKPVTSYVVLTRNSEDTIRGCLQSIQAQVGLKEIIIVDGNSSDRTLQIARKFTDNIVVLHDGNIATARQRGVDLANGRFIAFVDSDVAIPLDWTMTLLRILMYTKTEGEIAGVSSRYNPSEVSAVSYHVCESENLHSGTKFVDNLYFQSSIFHAKILKKFKFNPRWKRSGEDVDMSFQLREAGYFLIHTDETSVFHRSPTSLLGMMSRYFRYGMNWPKVMLAHRRFMTEKHFLWFLYVPIYLLMTFNLFWQLAVFVVPYVMHFYRYWKARYEFSLEFMVINGIKFQIHAIGIFIGLLMHIFKIREDS